MITLFSPSKVNLFFRILRKREDGYHEVATLLQAIDLGDWLTFARSESDQLHCTDPALPTDSSNLVLKAAELFRRKTDIPLFIEAHLIKRIPYQAGLGGGSGNAATTLWAMNELTGRPVAAADLAIWAGEIGSDISFFFSNGLAYCTGRGEKIESRSPLQPRKGWIAKPKEGLSTPQVYKNVNAPSLPQRDPVEALSAFESGKSALFNDLEPAAFMLMPNLLELKEACLKAGFEEVLLAGSGSALVCFGDAKPPEIAGVRWFPYRFLTRREGQWYTTE